MFSNRMICPKFTNWINNTDISTRLLWYISYKYNLSLFRSTWNNSKGQMGKSESVQAMAWHWSWYRHAMSYENNLFRRTSRLSSRQWSFITGGFSRLNGNLVSIKNTHVFCMGKLLFALIFILYIFSRIWNSSLLLMHFPYIEIAQLGNSLPMEVKEISIFQHQYRGCWCPGDQRSLGNVSHFMNIFLPEFSGLSTRMHK